jgi:general secretion pathway protein D
MKTRKDRKMIVLSVLCFWILGEGFVQAQTRDEQALRRAARGKEGVTLEELVSFKNDLSYVEAIRALSEMSKKFLGKPVIDPNMKEKPIGIGIDAMYWRDALETILRANGLWYTEHPDYFGVFAVSATPTTTTQITQSAAQPSSIQPLPMPGMEVPAAVPEPTEAEKLVKSREVTISTVFLEIDQTKAREIGFSFSLFKTRGMQIGFEFQGAAGVRSALASAEARQGPTRRLALDVEAALRFFESEALGEVIARPQVTVRSGQKGRVQIGTDFSVRSRTISGDITEQFYPTGTILDVTPTVMKIGDFEFVDISLSVERSSVTPGDITTIINRSKADTKLLLLDNEESYVGGLYINDESTQRQGIPILKDLPWWVFGLRYIFGFDAIRVTRKELVVLIKAEMVPLIEERVSQRDASRNLLKEKLQESREDSARRKEKN